MPIASSPVDVRSSVARAPRTRPTCRSQATSGVLATPRASRRSAPIYHKPLISLYFVAIVAGYPSFVRGSAGWNTPGHSNRLVTARGYESENHVEPRRAGVPRGLGARLDANA